MKYLLDTHTFLWYSAGVPKLSNKIIKIIDAKEKCYISIASLWEIAIKLNIGKLSIRQDFKDFINRQLAINNYEVLQIKLPHLYILRDLPINHRDPFDRIIISQAISENLTILSYDKAFKNYSVSLFWE